VEILFLNPVRVQNPDRIQKKIVANSGTNSNETSRISAPEKLQKERKLLIKKRMVTQP